MVIWSRNTWADSLVSSEPAKIEFVSEPKQKCVSNLERPSLNSI